MILFSKAATDVKLPRRSSLPTSVPKQISIWFNRDGCDGVKWKTIRLSGEARKAFRYVPVWRGGNGHR
ncbi:MAG: hypothetical protein ACYSUQ_12375, partial [Planctomycetota bacterium]